MLGFGHAQRRRRSAVGEPRVRPVAAKVKKLRVDERLQHFRTSLLIESPQALRLRACEAQPRHFEELAAHATYHLFCGHGGEMRWGHRDPRSEEKTVTFTCMPLPLSCQALNRVLMQA